MFKQGRASLRHAPDNKKTQLAWTWLKQKKAGGDGHQPKNNLSRHHIERACRAPSY
jgi:hypothetical protein